MIHSPASGRTLEETVSSKQTETAFSDPVLILEEFLP